MTELTRILDSSADLYFKKIKTDNELKINITDKLLEKILFQSIFTKLKYSVSHKGLESFYEKLIFIKDNFDKYKINAKNFYQLNREIKLEWKKINDEEFVILFV